MSGDRESFLRRVRQAVEEGNRAGGSPPLPDRGHVGYQGAGPDPVARLGEEVAAAGGQFHLVRDAAGAAATVVRLVLERSARRVLLGDGAFLETLGLEGPLAEAGLEVFSVSSLPAGQEREAFFTADVGVSGADSLLAETGAVALVSRTNQPRAVSLLPPVHIVVATREQILPDLFDLFADRWAEGLPACLSLITGPSKTGDIELKLVTGVHGPGEVHVVLLSDRVAT
jgi:L-lactate utilization protein LutC